VQPTHAVSDQRWAINRIGAERIKGAYAYKTLLSQFGMLAIGTDFPIERTNPFLTIHAAVQRRTATDESIEGFHMNEAISLEEVLRGMTIWAAFASFQENKLGSLEKGKDATFVIFERKVQSQVKFQQNYSWMTFVKGLIVYDANEL
jgi:predicted amidohydrolase YtcJ